MKIIRSIIFIPIIIAILVSGIFLLPIVFILFRISDKVGSKVSGFFINLIKRLNDRNRKEVKRTIKK